MQGPSRRYDQDGYLLGLSMDLAPDHPSTAVEVEQPLTKRRTYLELTIGSHTEVFG